MKVRITLTYDKIIDDPNVQLYKVFKHAGWVAGVVEQLERLDDSHVLVGVEQLDEQGNTIKEENA